MTTSATAPRADSRYRPEIEGLRALAALLVAVFHIWVGRVSGGVDVFFVVSGYLITTTLLGHLRRYGRVRPLAFLGRLLRRLLPQALTVLAVVLIAAWAMIPEALRERTFREVTASALYVENWQLAVSAVDYLDAADPHTPVQHFWAMSVQGQFYLLWAAIFMLASALVLRFRRGAGRFAAVIVAAVSAASFAFSVWWTAVDQPFAYFDTFARAWEFGAGSLAAFVLSRIRMPRALAAVLGWVGLLGILLCGAVLPVADAFPGAAALWPVCAVLLVLVSGGWRAAPEQAAWLLARRPLVWLGGLSYGFYLWHWPLLIFTRRVTGEESVGPLRGCAIIVLALVLAWLSTRLIERPARAAVERSARGRRSGVAVLLAAAVAIAGAGIASVQVNERSSAAREAAAETKAVADSRCFGAAAMLAEAGDCDNDPELLVPDTASLLKDTDGAYSCFTSEHETSVESCSIGSEEPGALRIALVGNSHAAMLIPALRDQLADRDWRLDTYVGNGCVWGIALPKGVCPERFAQLDEALLEGEPYDVLLVTMGNTGREVLPEQLESARSRWERIEARGTRVVVVTDNPRLDEATSSCVLGATPEELADGECSIPESQAYAVSDPFVRAAEGTDVPIVDLRDLYCRDGECPTVIGDVIVYRDQHHLTASYARTVGPILADRLEDVLGAGR